MYSQSLARATRHRYASLVGRKGYTGGTREYFDVSKMSRKLNGTRVASTQLACSRSGSLQSAQNLCSPSSTALRFAGAFDCPREARLSTNSGIYRKDGVLLPSPLSRQDLVKRIICVKRPASLVVFAMGVVVSAQ